MPGGHISITVPPLKKQIVGGHVNLFNAGLLLYRMVLAGIDCSKAKVKAYDYDISVIVKKTEAPELHRLLRNELYYDNGDIEQLAPYLPTGCRHQGFDGDIRNINWD